MRPIIAAIGFSLLFVASSSTLPAQWLKIKTPGLPRKADAKPDFTAAVARAADGKPDLSGLWGTEDNTYVVNINADLKPEETRAWAEALYRKRLDALDRDTPATRCLPGGPSEILSGQYRIVQQPNVVAILSMAPALIGRSSPMDVSFPKIRVQHGGDIRLGIGKGTPWWSNRRDSTTGSGLISRATRTRRTCG